MRLARLLPAVSSLMALAAPETAPAAPQTVVLSVSVAAEPGEVWEALTTREGLIAFFAPDASVDPRVGGSYEIYFLPRNPPGERGTEGVRILAFEPERRLMTGWNAPVPFGTLRHQQTVVEFLIEPQGPRESVVTLRHFGWGNGAEWEAVRDYFAQAWRVVLGRLRFRFEHGAVDWDDPPDGAQWFRPA